MMKSQLFASRSDGPAPSEETFVRATNGIHNYLPNKPALGSGLWTSTYAPSIGSDWIVRGREMGLVPDAPVRSFLLFPAPDARIFVIDDVPNLLVLLRRFERPTMLTSRMFASLDFDRIREEYDAIHLTEEGQWRTRFSIETNCPSLYGWDCESTLWLNWKFDDVTDLGVQLWEESRVPS